MGHMFVVMIMPAVGISHLGGDYFNGMRLFCRIWSKNFLGSMYKRDCLACSWDPRGAFSVKLVYLKWELWLYESYADLTHLNLLWKNVCPMRIEVFCWLAAQNTIATRGSY